MLGQLFERNALSCTDPHSGRFSTQSTPALACTHWPTSPSHKQPKEDVLEAYNRFCSAFFKAAHTAIPRGYRPLYFPCLDGESAALLQAYKTSGDPEIADHLIESLTTARRKKWEETVADLNFTHSSRKCWSLIRRLGAAQKPPIQSRASVTPNQVASRLLFIAKATQENTPEEQLQLS